MSLGRRLAVIAVFSLGFVAQTFRHLMHYLGSVLLKSLGL